MCSSAEEEGGGRGPSDGPLPTRATALLLYLVGPMVGFAIVAQITTVRGWRAMRAGGEHGQAPMLSPATPEPADHGVGVLGRGAQRDPGEVELGGSH